MTVSDAECEAFRRIVRENGGGEISVEEAREAIAELCTLIERFAAWREGQSKA